jgi:membrane glycosyltransferase
MKRAGYEVWLAQEDEGSYEEGPPNLTDMLKRDRRWCQGNLQHFWFLFARKVDFSNRLHIWKGLMSYGSSPLWFLFLLLSGLDAFGNQRSWTMTALPAEGFAGLNITAVQLLLLFTLGLLFAPKILGYLLALPSARQFGGILRMTAGLLLETFFAILIAPVLMLFHTRFVLMALLGVKVRWGPQNRDGSGGLSFGQCVRSYGWVFVVGGLSGIVTARYLPEYFLWFSPIVLSWLLAIPVAWITSQPALGRTARELGLFLIPEEISPSRELAGLDKAPPAPEFWPVTPENAARGIVQAVLNPYVHAIHISLLRQKKGRKPAADDTDLGQVARKLMEQGPASLTPEEEMKLLWNADILIQLHETLWKTPLSRLHASWGPCFENVAHRPG